MTRILGLVAPVDAPRAVRMSHTAWRDPRLWVGVALVAVCVVVGSRALASADDTVPVRVATAAIAAGTPVADVELKTVQIKLPDGVLGTLIGPETDLGAGPDGGAGLVFARPVGAGELVPADALAPAERVGLVEVPLAVDPDQVPPQVKAGSVVDVYVLVHGQATSKPTPPALSGVTVVAAPDQADALVATGKRQLVLAVPDALTEGFFATVGSAEQATVTVVRRR